MTYYMKSAWHIALHPVMDQYIWAKFLRSSDMSFYLIRSSAPAWDSWSPCQEPPSLASLMCFLSPLTGSHLLWEHLRCEPQWTHSWLQQDQSWLILCLYPSRFPLRCSSHGLWSQSHFLYTVSPLNTVSTSFMNIGTDPQQPEKRPLKGCWSGS